MIKLSPEKFLESFPDGACLIGPDSRILQINSRLTGMVGSALGRPCHEVLAGLTHVCPFCPFDDLVRGSAGPIVGAFQVRWGRLCMVNVRLLSEVGEGGALLETVRDLTEGDQARDLDERCQDLLPRLLKKLTGLLEITRDLMRSDPLEEKMDKLLGRVAASLDDPADAIVRLDLDDHTYGTMPTETTGTDHVQEIKVEGKARGTLHVDCPRRPNLSSEEAYFLEEVADLIGRQVEITDLWTRLRLSEERHKKLAKNLSKEIWTRTEALVKESGYLEGILKSSDDMIITTDLEGRIVEFNPGAEKILGYTAEEVQGRKISDVWLDAAEREKLMEEVNLSGGIRNYQTRLKTKKGEFREIFLTLSLLRDEQGKILGTVGVSKDIGRESADQRELEQLNQNYRETIHFINHENKNSLIVIAGFVRRLLETEADPARKEQLAIVYHHSQFLEAMSRDFLVMAELEHGEFQVKKTLIRNFYEDVVLPAMIGLKERYPDSFQSYDESMGGVGAIQLMGDPGLLEVVYRNLFGNALKYRYLHGKIAYGVVERADSYLFNVWNEGPGVSPDQVQSIFDKFYRVRNDATQEKPGTGLGLYNIRRIIEAHGGRIWCETKPGEWINFLFVLPKG
jgi:PAS domain S-box-containing protein